MYRFANHIHLIAKLPIAISHAAEVGPRRGRGIKVANLAREGTPKLLRRVEEQGIKVGIL